MIRLRAALLLLPLIGGAWAPEARSQDDGDPYGGLYRSPEGGVLELHRGPDGALRGSLRSGDRIAALAPIEVGDGGLAAGATWDDGERTELRLTPLPGPQLVVDGRAYRRTAVEGPADATVRRAVEDAYAALAAAVRTRDYAAFQALRVPEFATIPPDGVPSPASRMAERARGMLERIQPPITVTHEVLDLVVRGDDAIATVRQTFTRTQFPVDAGTGRVIESDPHTIRTEVTQRETWTRTPEGWKLLFVDEVRDGSTFDNGVRVK